MINRVKITLNMSIIKDINVPLRDIAGYSKAYLPFFREELVTADIDAVIG